MIRSGTKKSFQLESEITETGKYIVLVAVCDSTVDNIQITGEVEVLNPYGYLPAKRYGTLAFSYALLILYFVFSLYWIIRCAYYRSQVMMVHNIIGYVLAVRTITIFLNCIDVSILNRYGSYFHLLRVGTLVMEAASSTLARTLIVLLSIG